MERKTAGSPRNERLDAPQPEPQNLAPVIKLSANVLTPASDLDSRVDGQHHPSVEEHGRQPDNIETRKYTGRLPMVPRISGSDTLEILTGWLDLASHRLGVQSNFGAPLKYEGQVLQQPTISLDLPPVPPKDKYQDALNFYSANIHSIYPLLETSLMFRIMDDAAIIGPKALVQNGQLLQLLSAYLVLILGNGINADLVPIYISFCETMVGHVIGWGTIDAVRVVFLLALVLKLRDMVASAWPMAGLCVSMATSMGLNRKRNAGRRSREFSTDEVDQERRRTWVSTNQTSPRTTLSSNSLFVRLIFHSKDGNVLFRLRGQFRPPNENIEIGSTRPALSCRIIPTMIIHLSSVAHSGPGN